MFERLFFLLILGVVILGRFHVSCSPLGRLLPVSVSPGNTLPALLGALSLEANMDFIVFASLKVLILLVFLEVLDDRHAYLALFPSFFVSTLL